MTKHFLVLVFYRDTENVDSDFLEANLTRSLLKIKNYSSLVTMRSLLTFLGREAEE